MLLVFVLALLISRDAESVPPASYPSLEALIAMSADDLQAVGIDLVNFTCAQGLSGSEAIDITKADMELDRWAVKVSDETEKYRYLFRQNPAKFKHSEGNYRMQMMVTVLMQDYRISYTPSLVDYSTPAGVFYADSRDIFLHGLVERRLGTCASLPVLYVAVGRRLGYPVYLAQAKNHLYVRWESTGQVFNVEGTNGGMVSHPDEYYHTWPVPLSESELRSGHYLRSLTPKEELFTFLSLRRHCLKASGREVEASHIYQILDIMLNPEKDELE